MSQRLKEAPINGGIWMADKDEKGKLWHRVQAPEEMADIGRRQEDQAQTMKQGDDKIPQAGFNIQKQMI